MTRTELGHRARELYDRAQAPSRAAGWITRAWKDLTVGEQRHWLTAVAFKVKLPRATVSTPTTEERVEP